MSNQVQEIKDKLDIIEIISEYVQLNKAGTYHKAKCPFHSEKTASFMVNQDRGTWHCFGCNEGGDIFTFMQKIEGLTFRETLEILAKRAGVVLEKQSIQTKNNIDESSKLKNVLFDAAQVYQTILKDAEGAQVARDYIKKRGIDEKTQKVFMLGYAPEKWDVLISVLTKRGHSISDISKAGLSVRSERGSYFDRFRERIMFPIFDHHGSVVGFTGRILNENQKGGKYVNTPQTAVFDKSRLLYGLDRAKQEIRKTEEAVVVEGQMDVIACHQVGFLNTVASSGTALTELQLALLKRYANTIKIAFDKDNAGQNAALRGIGIALSLGIEVKVIQLEDSDGKDPDDCIQKNKNAWTQRVEQAKPYIQWLIDNACARFDTNDAKGKRKIGEMVLPFITQIQSAIERDHWISKLSQALQVDNNVVYAEFETIQKKQKNPQKIKSQEVEKQNRSQMFRSPFVKLLALHIKLNKKEKHECLIQQLLPKPFHPLVENVELVYNDKTIHVRNVLEMLVERLYPAFDSQALESEYQKIQRVCTDKIRQYKLSKIARLLRDAEERGDKDRIAQLLDSYQAIIKSSVDPIY